MAYYWLTPPSRALDRRADTGRLYREGQDRPIHLLRLRQRVESEGTYIGRGAAHSGQHRQVDKPARQEKLIRLAVKRSVERRPVPPAHAYVLPSREPLCDNSDLAFHIT